MTPSDLFAQTRTFWKEATPPARAAIAGGGVLLLILAISFMFLAASPDFVRVYSGTPSEAQGLAKELEKAGIPYQISEDGGTLSVKRSDAGRTRQISGGVAQASEGSSGLRGLDAMGPFTTYEQQRVRIERAQEEALAGALGQYAGVQKAEVNLALPSENSQVGEATPPKAAVTITPRPGASFTEAQIAAMAQVVANSIPNLTPENVTIASSEGTTLWAGAASVDGSHNDGILRMRTRAEKEYIRARRAELQASLDSVFGPGKAIVYVDATLDFDKQETEAKRVVPAEGGEKGLPVSENSSTEQYTGGAGPNGGAGGVVGADANRPGAPSYPAATGGAGGKGGNYKNTTETVNYDNSIENVRTVKAVGEPKRQNVSVWVDDKLPAAVQRSVDTWLRGSVINPTNAAYTTVTSVAAPFDRTAETATKTAQAAAERQAWLQAYAPYIVLPVCLALMLAAAFLLTRRKPEPATAVAAGRGGAAGAPEMALAGGVPGGLPGGGAAFPGATFTLEAGTALTPGDGATALADGSPAAAALEAGDDDMIPAVKIQHIHEKIDPGMSSILEFIDKQPEAAALLLRSWTNDEPARPASRTA